MHDTLVDQDSAQAFIVTVYDRLVKWDRKSINPDYRKRDSLEWAVYSLELASGDLSKSIIYITNGVENSGFREFVPRLACRQIVASFIQMVVVQVGSSSGFNPNSDYSHIPNNEYLRFLSESCGATFTYAADCPYVEESMEPNFYHDLFILPKFHPNSSVPVQCPLNMNRNVDVIPVRLANNQEGHQETDMSQELAFPWHKSSKPPSIVKILCGYRDYKIPQVKIGDVIHARMQEGFLLKDIKYKRRAGKSSEKVEIMLVLPWLPHVTVDYTLKFSWNPISDGPLLNYLSPKYLRIELNVLAHHSFAILFINVHDIDGRDTVKNSLHDRLVQLHMFLRDIHETDESIKVI